MSEKKRVYRKLMTAEEAAEYLMTLNSDDDDDDDVLKMYMEPPNEEGNLSGEDSADEDFGGNLDNLPKQQLQAPCELVIRSSAGDSQVADYCDDLEITQFITDVLDNSSQNLSVGLLQSPQTEPRRESSPLPSTSHSDVSMHILSSTPVPSNSQNTGPSATTKKQTTQEQIQITQPKLVLRARKNARKSAHLTKLAPAKRSKPTESSSLVWIDDAGYSWEPCFPDGNFTDCVSLQPYQQFEKFFDDTVIKMLCDQTNSYAVFRNAQSPNVTENEMKVFLGILIVSGYSTRPSKRHFWSERSDLICPMISNAMRRDRFETIARYLHFIDPGNEDRKDKIWKIRPLTDLLKARFIQHFKPERDLSYDESMVEYYGRHGCKQFIRGKPLRFGYKMWSLNTPLGYLINFEMYQGNNPRINSDYEQKYGKNIAPLFCMLDELREEIKQMPFCLHFDNLFTSIKALMGLKLRGYHGTGTIRENMIPKSCPLMKKETLKKQPRGYMECKVIKDCEISLVKWMDNSAVTVASTAYALNPVSKVKRYSRIEKKRIDVTRPYAVAKYNAGMGGTDRMDQNVNAYRIGIRGKKWWFSIFTWLVDVSIQNAWYLHKKGGSGLSQLEFRQSIAEYYCCTLGNPKLPGGYRFPKKESEYTEIRYDRVDHLIDVIPNKKRRRCQGENCKSSVTTMCTKCDVGLCFKCFRAYHLISTRSQ